MNQQPGESELKGLSVSKGIAHAEAFVLLHKEVETPVYEIRDDEKPRELEKFQSALIKTRSDIQRLKDELSQSVGESEASIFDAHMLVLEDVAVIQETQTMFERGNYNIEYCYAKVIDRFIEAFERIDDPFIRERISDLKDVSRRVMANMMGIESLKMGGLVDPIILVSTDFTPADFSMIDKAKLLAIVTERGSQTSHTAILARSLGIPCIVGISDILDKIPSGEPVLVDGYKGNVFVNPTDRTIAYYTEVATVQKSIAQVYATSLGLPPQTPDGVKFNIDINISAPIDITEEAMKYCDGVGLFRTENFFINYGSFPDEQTQFKTYKAAAEAAGGKPVVIRTLDLGGDKNMNLLKLVNEEENPFMGYRAIRFCLDHEDVFMLQLRAILRASAFGKVKILLPMISSIREVERARALIDRAKEQLAAEGADYDKNIEIGVMVEVPSAAMTVDVLAQACDFFSIGTNDLIQYTLAVDRVNELVANLYEPTHPAVIRTIDMVVKAAQRAGKPVGVCGELAADPSFVPLLLGMGVTEFSMSYTAVSEVKFLLCKTTLEEARKLRDEVMEMTRSRHIISKLRSFHYEKMQPYLPS